LSDPTGRTLTGILPEASPAAAFVDLDGTLLSVSSEKLFLEALYRAGELSRAGVLSFAANYLTHPLRTISEGRGWNRSYLRRMFGVRFREFAAEFAGNELAKAVRPWLAEMVIALSEAGWKTILMTASLEPLASAVAEGLPFDRIVASVPEENDGRLTGKLSGPRPWGREKVILAQRECAGMSMPLDSCMALGDSSSDRHLLESCGYPIAVCPDRKLRAIASERSWAILEGRPVRWA